MIDVWSQGVDLLVFVFHYMVKFRLDCLIVRWRSTCHHLFVSIILPSGDISIENKTLMHHLFNKRKNICLGVSERCNQKARTGPLRDLVVNTLQFFLLQSKFNRSKTVGKEGRVNLLWTSVWTAMRWKKNVSKHILSSNYLFVFFWWKHGWTNRGRAHWL